MKFFLSGILAIVVCLSLHAGEQTTQPEVYSNGSSCIYIADNAKIYGKEHLYTKQNASKEVANKGIKARRKTLASANGNIDKKVDEKIDKKEPGAVVFPDFPSFPYAPSSFYLNTYKESAAPVSQHKFCGHHSTCKANRGNAYPDAGISYLSLLLPKQRHNLSPAATQCGILTSFSPHSPSLSYFVI